MARKIGKICEKCGHEGKCVKFNFLKGKYLCADCDPYRESGYTYDDLT